MMNSSHTTETYAASPFMSFVGIEGSGSTQNSQKHQLWDWDSSNTFSSTTHSLPFYATHTIPTLLDAPPPSLFTFNTPLPFYFPPPPPPPPPQPSPAFISDYPRTSSFFKLEDGLTGGFGGLAGARIGLNLGHRTYFSSVDHQLMLFGRSAHHQPPRCQAEGCRADLSGAKHYHRRHKVCDFHSKASVVFFPGGVQQRFCQQCSRFHGLAEFDDTKRSCRKRLAEHNRRRRKPQAQPTAKSGASSSIAPTIKAKEENKLISGSKTSKQLSSIIKSNNTTAPILISNSNTSLEVQQKKALAQFTSGSSALSLGGVGGSTTYEHQRVSTLMSIEEKASQYQQQFQSHFTSPCSSSNTYFPNQNFFNEGSHSGGGSEMNHHNQSSILQLGQAMFEWDFI